MDNLTIKINDSIFIQNLIIKTKDIYANHLKLYINESTRPDFDIDEFGNAQEIKLKKVFKRYNNLIDHLEKLLIIPKYFDFEDINDICEKLDIKEIEYYQYHFENSLIRLVTSLDLCAKIGSELYELKIPEKKCNWQAFINHKEIIGKKCCTTLLSFSNYLETIRTERHLIIHHGGYESDKIKSIESNIVDNNLLPIENILKEWFNSNKNEELKRLIDLINNKIENSLQYIFDFLDSMNPELIIN